MYICRYGHMSEEMYMIYITFKQLLGLPTRDKMTLTTSVCLYVINLSSFVNLHASHVKLHVS